MNNPTSTLTPTVFHFQDQPIREISDTKGEPWFCAKDVCDILGLDNVSMAMAKIPEIHKGVNRIDTPSGIQQMHTVDEPGLYRLVLRCNKPQAEPFMEFVTAEVLPAIRQHGGYTQAQANLAGLAGQFHQASLALAAPGLSDRRRWEMASGICTALFGEESAYLLGEKEIKLYTSQLNYRKTHGHFDSDTLAIINITPQGLKLSMHAKMYYLAECCTVKAGLAASERGLYQAFDQWWQHSFAVAAPPLEMFRAMLSDSHRRFTLADETWYLGLEPKESTPWQRAALATGKEVAA
jgi:prophage antirepressor-like protein